MSSRSLNTTMLDSKGRAVGGTENSWCRAVIGGTGIAVLAILSSKNPDISRLRNAIHKLQSSHPILRSRLHYNPGSNTFSFVTSPSPFIQIKSFNHSTTSNILENLHGPETVSPLHLILEHELNQNDWTSSYNPSSPSKNDMFFVSVYALPGARWALVLLLHASACDRTTAMSLLRELLTLMSNEEDETGSKRGQKEIMLNKGAVSLAIEDLIPKGKAKKTLLARGIDMLGYSVSSFRLTNLKFKDTKSPRSTQVLRLLINPDDTQRIMAGCKARGIKLCGALAAAGLIAAHGSKCCSDHQKKKYGWCRAVPSGTGITVLSLLLSNIPDIPSVEAAISRLQVSHPILRSRLHFDASRNSFDFITPCNPHFKIQSFDLQSTTRILQSFSGDSNIDSHQLLLEHELNRNSWSRTDGDGDDDQADQDVFFVSLYILSETRWLVVFRLHTSACDRAAAVGLLRELLELVGGGGTKAVEEVEEIQKANEEKEVELSLGIEDLIPSGKANKPLWARGLDLLGYSLNSFRLANLNFVDANSARRSQVVRLQMNHDETDRLVAGCKSRGIKLCGALAAAGLIAARSTKAFPDQQSEKYAVITLIDCRLILEPVLSSNHFGFYHSAILNTHDVTANEELWQLANRCYTSLSDAKNNNKHFTDMNDLNFLMCKAIDNPGLTPSSSLRTAFISVFEDPVIDESNKLQREIGLVDYVGCSSVHGIGPTLAIFDTVRDGCLDCACVYPAPLHSREQMQELIDSMKKILADGSINMESNG